MATARDELLHEAQGQRLGICKIRVELAQFRVGIETRNSSSAAAIGALDENRVANFVGQCNGVLGFRSLKRLSGDGWNIARIRKGSRANFVAQGIDGLGRRTNPDQSGFLHAGSKVGVLRKESISRVNGAGTGLLCDLEDCFGVEIGFCSAASAQGICGCREFTGEGVTVCFRVNGNRFKTEFTQRADHANSNFTSVRNENGRKGIRHDRCPSTSGVGESSPVVTVKISPSRDWHTRWA